MTSLPKKRNTKGTKERVSGRPYKRPDQDQDFDQAKMSDADLYLLRIGLRLRSLRISAGLSLRQLDALTRIDNSKLAKIEKGKINLTQLTMKAILDGLNVKPEDFWKF